MKNEGERMDNIHKGHRDRLKNRYREHGLESFTDIEALELLLFYAVPRCDTNVLAHALLDRFHGFRGVMEADVHELAEVKGIGENAATLIALVADLNHRYLTSARENMKVIRSAEDAGRYFVPLFSYQTEEIALLVCLDSANRVLSCHDLGRGMMNKVDFSVREAVSIVLRENAAAVLLAHNHISDVAVPSRADVVTTAKFYNALKLIGVELLDHIVVGEDDFVSMRDSGYFLKMT